MTVTQEDLTTRLERFVEEGNARYVADHPRSAELTKRARTNLIGGVTSDWQKADPQPIWIAKGQGSRLWDADGYEMVDMHGGFGVSIAGHAHPAVVEAVREQVGNGTHFAQPVETAIEVAALLAERWGLPKWRFGNSGTESTMDAVHLMRAATGRKYIVKIEGTYHGHHDSVLVNVHEEGPELGDRRHPNSVPANGGIPDEIIQLTRTIPYNDLDAARELFAEYDGQIAGLIIEPIMMNIGQIMPDDGYLQGLKDLCHANGALLTFDEVKTGFTIAPGGATEYFGVTPDIVCIAKALGGGIAVSAIGGTQEVMATVEDGDYEQVGTFNGNPLAMAAAYATLTQVLTPEAYAEGERRRQLLTAGCQDAIDRYELPAYVESCGFKGAIVYATEKLRDHRDFMEVDNSYSLAAWFFQINGGVFLPGFGKFEPWTFSVQHTDDDVMRFAENLAEFGAFVRS